MFFLASDLGPSGAARQIGLLATGLRNVRARAEVGVLGPANTPIADDLRRAGIRVHAVPLRSPIDFRGMRALRRVVDAATPTVVHAWGPAAVRATAGLLPRSGEGSRPVVVSATSSPGGGLFGWLTTRRAKRSTRVVAASWADGERYRRLGIASGLLTRVSPAVAPAPPPPGRDAFLRELGLPPTARLVMTAGRLESGPELQAAVWAFDMLRYEFPGLYLLIFGTGQDQAGLEAFGQALGFDDYRVRFPGYRADLPAVLGLAEVVWVTQNRGGVNLALEAMAAGRPVVGWKSPDLIEVVDEGETGFLVDPKERALVSARTHGLLSDAAVAARFGAAGRARAAERFGIPRMVELFRRVYESVIAGQ